MKRLCLLSVLSIGSLGLAQAPVSQDGLTVSAPEVFDTYYLQQQLNSLRTQLEALQVVNSATITGHTAQGRWGAPVDLAGAYQFLASDASAFVTGTVLSVDGGYLLV